MTASYGLALGGAFSRGVPDARDLIEQARYAESLGYHWEERWSLATPRNRKT